MMKIESFTARSAYLLHHIASVIRDPGHNDIMFLRHPLADIQHRFGNILPSELKESIRLFLCRDSMEYQMTGGTENHKLMNAVSGYLSAQTWTDWPEAPSLYDFSKDPLMSGIPGSTQL
jgi:hypothetical protein